MKNIPFAASAALLVMLTICPASFASSDHHEASGPNADAVLKDLESGNKRFVEGKPQHELQDASRRKELTKGQKPSAIVLSCSDSRVPPEVVFDKGLGELFTIRVAGNVLGAATVASIEYAVEHLGSRLIVVMGHESCGAVAAAINTPAGKTAGSVDLDSLISTIQPALDGIDRASAAADKTLRKPVMHNVNSVAKRLLSRSKIVRKAVESGAVKIVPAIYSLETGKVDFWNRGSTPAEASAAVEGGKPADSHSH